MKRILFFLLFSVIYSICSCDLDSSHSDEETKTTLKAETTTLVPKLDSCDLNMDLFEDGIYLKSFCSFNRSFTHEDGRKKCADNNMNLFIINNKSVESEFYYAIMSTIGKAHPTGHVWINGQKNPVSRRWETYNIDGSVKGQVYNKLKWYSKYNNKGACLRFSGQYNSMYSALAAKCEEGGWAVCEHSKQTQLPQVQDPGVCLYIKDLYTPMKKYLKSVCVVDEDLNYYRAQRRCVNLKMNLFQFDSEDIVDAFYEDAANIMLIHPGGHYWINGERDTVTNVWNLHHVNKTNSGVIHKSFEWVNKGYIRGETSGLCLRLSGQHGPYQGLGTSCDQISWAICEFHNQKA